jgi:plasmid rolling circle replication initiator protein Rep
MNKDKITVNGNGTDLKNTEALKGRAKRKMITQNLAISLVDVAQKKGEDERVKSFWNTYHCQNRIYSSGERLYGKYCKNRFCTLCCSIRKAYILNKYLPIIQQWEEPYFVTLTMKSVPAKLLKQRIANTLRAFRIIINRYRKQYQRGKAIKLIGIKSLECNFNPQRKTYNPHLHLIVPNKEIADTLVKEWLKLWTVDFTRHYAQCSKKIDNMEKALIEVVKYGSKIFTSSDLNKKAKEQIPQSLYVSALNNILRAMKGRRIFERFGFNLKDMDTATHKKSTQLSEYLEWEFDLKQADWINYDTGQLLSGFIPKPELLNILENGIDNESE